MKNLILLTLGLGVIAIFQNCQKEQYNAAQLMSQNTAFNRDECKPEFDENPYDLAGAIHNEGLNYIAENSNGQGLSVSLVVQLNEDFSNKMYPDLKANIMTEEEVKMIVSEAFLGNMGNLIQNYETSQVVKDQFSKLFNLIESSSSIGTYCEVKERIVNFEKLILDNKELSETEKSQILAAASIARYSTWYWSTVQDQPFNPNGGEQKAWWQIVLADVGAGCTSLSEGNSYLTAGLEAIAASADAASAP
jgi:hypothetical protein